METQKIMPKVNTKTISSVFELQKQHFRTVALSNPQERIQKLQQLRKVVLEHQIQIQEAIYQDFKKPATETDLTEIFPTISGIKHVIKKLHQWMKPRKVATPLPLMGTSSFVIHEPKGQALIISPWNYPFLLMMSPLTYAIASGCVAILKPSEMTPNTARIIRKIVEKVFEQHEFAVIEGGVETATELLKLRFDHIYFTGSPAVGKIVMQSASRNLTSVTLELGGKSPVIIDKSVNLDDVARKLTWGKCLNAGQTCVAPDYAFVHESQKDKLIELIKAQIQKSYYSDTKEKKASDLSRIVNQRHFERVCHLIDDAVKKGAKIEHGGDTDESENYISPTILTNISDEMEVMQQEIFAPVLPILTYKNLEDVYEYIAKKPKPLALYAFGKDSKKLQEILTHTTAGGTCFNECIVHLSHHDLPFGGVNNSGIGKSHGIYGFEAFSNKRALLKQRTGLTGIQFFYPPYTKKVQKYLDLLMRYFG